MVYISNQTFAHGCMTLLGFKINGVIHCPCNCDIFSKGCKYQHKSNDFFIQILLLLFWLIFDIGTV